MLRANPIGVGAFIVQREAGEHAMVKVAKTGLRAAALTAALGILAVGIILA
jgi:hypothetical protein